MTKTLQEIFDTMATHLLKQMRRSHDIGSDACLYRSDEGLKCGVGALIHDEHYDPSVENMAISDASPNNALGRALAASGVDIDSPVHMDLMEDVQITHDELDPDLWRDRLRAVARRFDLSPTVLD